MPDPSKKGFVTTIYLFLTVPCLFIAVLINAQPVISGFNPAKAAMGSSIVISGLGFSSVPANNIVHIGGIIAPVMSSSANTITATVPGGTSPDLPVTVTTNGLTAYAPSLFITTFPGSAGFTSNSFTTGADITTPDLPADILTGDLDQDGKTDMVTVNETGKSFSVYRNISTTTTISFNNRIDFPTVITPYSIAIGDLDGDGLPDIVTGSANNGQDSVSVYRNTSSPGVVLFTLIKRYAAAKALAVQIGELNGDGKPEIVSTNATGISVFRNTSSSGLISFNEGIHFAVASNLQDIAICDMNSNGKMDIITCGYDGYIRVQNNSGSGSTISFDAPESTFIGSGLVAVAVGDLDDNMKPDLAAASYTGKLFVLRNFSASSFSFSVTTITTASVPYEIEIADMDGDGKPDLVCPLNDESKSVKVYKNTTVAAMVNQTPQNYFSGDRNWRLAIADFRNTGTPDIATLKKSVNAIVVLRNKLSDPPAITSFVPTAAGAGFPVTIKGINLLSASAAGFGGVPAVSVLSATDTSVTAIIGTGASGEVTVTTLGGTASKPGFSYIPITAITSFSPLSGPVGSHVKINGTAFDPNPAANIVYFGAAKATVNSATTTSLNVIVPAGAIYGPLSVTVNGYTTYSALSFDLLFADGNISASTFTRKIELFNGLKNEMSNVTMGDIDGDGLNDLLVPLLWTNTGFGYDSMAVYRNTSANGIISFAPRVTFKNTTDAAATNITCADFNGDGKLDIATIGGRIDIFRNTSTAGSISFAQPVPFISEFPLQVVVNDVDGDGKSDMIVSEGDDYFYVYKNTSPISGISFAPPKMVQTAGGSSGSVVAVDMDGDGKPELAACNLAGDSIVVFRNTSIPGIISLSAPLKFNIGRPSTFITAGDIDGDGRNDLIVGLGVYIYGALPWEDSAVIVMRNKSTIGLIALDTPVISRAIFPRNIALADFDGDGKVDLAGLCRSDSVTIFRNNSQPGSIDISTTFRYMIITISGLTCVAAGDLDGDGKPEIVIANESKSALHILINQNGSDVEYCPGGSRTLYSDITNSPCQWQVNTGSGFVNISNGPNYNGVNTIALDLINIPSAWYGNRYRCIVNGNSSKEFTIKVINRWTGAVDASWENPGNWSCGSVPDTNADVIISTGSVIISSNVTVRTLKLEANVSLTLNTGYNIVVLH